jgi:hypothetical protein
MTTIDTYQESTDISPIDGDYLIMGPCYFEDSKPLPFYDTPITHPLMKEFHRRIEIKRRILEYCAKY